MGKMASDRYLYIGSRPFNDADSCKFKAVHSPRPREFDPGLDERHHSYVYGQ
jgi:hypothetical protein